MEGREWSRNEEIELLDWRIAFVNRKIKLNEQALRKLDKLSFMTDGEKLKDRKWIGRDSEELTRVSRESVRRLARLLKEKDETNRGGD